MRRLATQIMLFVALASAVAGCRAARGPTRPVPLPPNTRPEQLVDADDTSESLNPLSADALAGAAEAIKEQKLKAGKAEADKRKAADKSDKKGGAADERKPYEILLLSGGAVYGAYSAGVLAGWTAHGDRPKFDVVTGISTGSLIAPLAFLGSEYDHVIKSRYTGVTNKDLFTIRKQIRGLFTESIADVSPFREKLYESLNAAVIRAVAAEHAKGRRCYVGSTNLDTKRLIVWDLGAIATRNTPEADNLFREAIVASCSIPGFFPSVRFDTLIDGAAYQELHVDGGITQSMFFRAPYVPASKREAFGPESLADSNLYMLVAGKLFPDPEGVKPRTLAVVGASVSALLYASTRQDLYRLYLLCVLTGMNFYYNAIPPAFKTTSNSTNFDPTEMQKLYDEGFKQGSEGVVKKKATKAPKAELGGNWQNLPPGLHTGEEVRTRSGVRLTARQEQPPQPVQPTADDGKGASPQTGTPVAK